MHYLLILAILVYMFMSPTVSSQLGIEKVGSTSLILFVPIIIYRVLLYHKLILIKNLIAEFRIILVGIIVCLLGFFKNDLPLIERALYLIIFPMLISVVLTSQSFKINLKIQNVILLFFIAECLLAIYEKLIGVNLFPIIEYSSGEVINSVNQPFRSTAFLGHPLGNSLVISIIMGFVLISNKQLYIKGLIYGLGIVAILCFEARGALLIWIFITVIVLCYLSRDIKYIKYSMIKVFVFITLVFFLLSHLITDFGLGQRLINEELYDGSAKTRVDVFGAFNFVDSSDLIFGNSSNYIYITGKLGASGVENSYIVLILFFGIPIFLLLIASYFFLFKKYFRTLNMSERIIILLSFILVGSTNNALAGATPWMFFVFCSYAFIPLKNNFFLKKPYLR